MLDIGQIIDFLDREEALFVGETPWKSHEREEGVDYYSLDWQLLFADDTEKEWEAAFDDEFLSELERAMERARDQLPAAPPRQGGRDAEWDVCAWYQPVHFFGYDWGIFIRQDCVLRQALELANYWVPRQTTQAGTVARARTLFRTSLAAYFLHEHYHHKVECFSLRLHVAKGRPCYAPYHRNVYKPNCGSDDLIEEALANADMCRRLQDKPYRPADAALRHAAKQLLLGKFRYAPGGYRRAPDYLADSQFATGEDRLQAQVAEATPQPQMDPADWDVAPHMMRSFFSFRSDIWYLVPHGQRPVVPANSYPLRTCSTADMVVILGNAGYQQVPGGKGSHVKLKKPKAPTVILPGGRANLSPVVARNALRAIGRSISEIGDLLP